jgi:hypothetical protein
MKASWIAPNFWFSWPAMASALWPGPRRSSKGFSVVKTMPELELLVKPLIERPGERDRVFDAGLLQCDVTHAADHVFGAVERGAVGQLGKADQVLLVLCRHEAMGHRP